MLSRRSFIQLAAVPLGAKLSFAQSIPKRQLPVPLLLGFKGTKAGDIDVETAIDHLVHNRAQGLVFFDRNVVSPSQMRRLTSHIRRGMSGRPIILAVDQEGGRVQRLSAKKGYKTIPSAQTVCTTQRVDQAKVTYSVMASEVSTSGLNFNFAPVVDVNLNPTNPVIGGLNRSFSADPDIVAAYAEILISAHDALDIGTCLKHFPGHGSSLVDTHLDFADITKVWDAEIELRPYRSVHGMAVMVAHLTHRLWSQGRKLPSSLSSYVIQRLLRGRLNFEGAVIVDDLQMNAISKRWKTEEAAVLSLAAGADIVIVGNVLNYEPDLPFRLELALTEALDNGTISQVQFRASENRRSALLAKVTQRVVG